MALSMLPIMKVYYRLTVKNWNLFPLPNKTNVRSVAIGSDNKIYVGGQDEIGYFEPAKNGLLQYQSLTELIPKKDRTGLLEIFGILSRLKTVFSSGRLTKFSSYPTNLFLHFMPLPNGLILVFVMITYMPKIRKLAL